MSNVAHLSLDPRTQKWTAIYAGRVLAASPNKDYVVTNIRAGRCTKARLAGVTDVVESGQIVETSTLGPPQEVERFSIDERFEFLESFTTRVAKRKAKSLIVTGEGGLGKTFTVNQTLKSLGMQDLSKLEMKIDALDEESDKQFYNTIKGYSSPKGLYRTLFENRNRTIVFDDCDSVLQIPVALNLLKGALDSYDTRIICWNAEAFGDDDLPRSFEFKGGVIFISNMPKYKIDQAVRSRALACVDLSMTTDQKLERMATIIKSPTFMSEIEMKVKKAALALLSKMRHDAKELSMRTLISVITVAADGGNWEREAEYLIISGT